MAYNRKMRKFEGTCYIPGEQLAMMAKYYRGANLNLNLTLFEDDLATMQETLDQACWCSKLDEVDRMKMAHMKGNEWRIQHDHCVQNGQLKPGENNPLAFTALPQRSKSTVGKVERGTSALSLYEREKALGRGQEDYSEPRNRRDDYYDFRNRRQEYFESRNRRSYYDTPYRRGDNNYGPLDAQQNRGPARGSMGGITDRRYEMESEAAMSSLPEIRDIKCAVCNAETCLVCKNHLYSSICQCKCLVANAGLCKKCSPCEEEEEQEQMATVTGGNKMDMSSMMLTMMMSSMLKQSQTPESVCCCKPSRDNSYSSSDSSDDKVHKVYLYDCEAPAENNKKSKRKSRKAASSSDSFSCNCCKCSGKPKNDSGKKEKRLNTSGEDNGEHNQKRKSRKGNGSKESKDGNRKSKRGDRNSETELEQKGSHENAKKSTAENRKPSKANKEEVKNSSKSSKDESPKDLNMKHLSRKSIIANKVNPRGSKAHESIDSRNVQFSQPGKSPLRRNSESSSSESDDPRQSVESRQKSPPNDKHKPHAQKSDTQDNGPDMESSNQTKIDADILGEESSTAFNLKEFIVCLPKIQSNLQSLMSKLNQMDVLSNQLQGPKVDAEIDNTKLCLDEFQIRQDVPLISPLQESLSSIPVVGRGHAPVYSQDKNHESEISIGHTPCNFPNMPPTISPSGSWKGGTKICQPFNIPTGYESRVNVSNLGNNPQLKFNITPDGRKAAPMTAPAVIPTQKQPIIKFSYSNGSNNTNYILGSSGNLSFQKDKPSNLGLSSPHAFLKNNAASNVMQGRPFHQNADNPSILLSGGSPNKEMFELPANSSHSPVTSLHKQSKIPNPRIESSGKDEETIFQSYKQELLPELSDPDLTDYASFTEEKYFLPSQAASMQQACLRQGDKVGVDINVPKNNDVVKISKNQEDQCYMISKRSRKYLEQHTTKTPRSKAPTTTKFKAKQRSPLVLGKLIQGCTVRQISRFQGIRSQQNHADSQGNTETRLLEQGVGPGKFRHSNSDSRSDHTNGNRSDEKTKIRTPTLLPASAGNNTETIPTGIGKKNSSQLKRNLSPKMQSGKAWNSGLVGQTDCSDSMLKMSDAYMRHQVDSQNYIVSSVELKAISNEDLSTEILKMVHRMASSSLTNETRLSSELPQTMGYNSEFDIIPLLPLSSTTPYSDSKSDHPSGSVVEKNIDNEVPPNTPAFLRKSRIQVEQLKRAHETIRSMIKNVNDVIAHIDSDSKIGIKSKTRSEDKERQSYFVRFDDEKSPTGHLKSQDERLNSIIAEKIGKSECVKKTTYSSKKQDRGVRELFVSVNRVINSVLEPSEQSSSAQDPQWPSETTTPSRAHRDFFVLNSESTSTAFTESLRRSLENDTSRSVPLATQTRVPSYLCGPNQQPRSTRPLKRRSWFQPPK